MLESLGIFFLSGHFLINFFVKKRPVKYDFDDFYRCKFTLSFSDFNQTIYKNDVTFSTVYYFA